MMHISVRLLGWHARSGWSVQYFDGIAVDGERLRVHPQGDVLCSASYIRNEVGLFAPLTVSFTEANPKQQKAVQRDRKVVDSSCHGMNV